MHKVPSGGTTSSRLVVVVMVFELILSKMEIMRFIAAWLIFLATVPSAQAEARRTTSVAASLPKEEGRSSVGANRNFQMTPENERLARENQDKADAVDKKMTAKGRRLTNTICSGCGGEVVKRGRSHSAASGRTALPTRDQEHEAFDPATSPYQ